MTPRFSPQELAIVQKLLDLGAQKKGDEGDATSQEPLAPELPAGERKVAIVIPRRKRPSAGQVPGKVEDAEGEEETEAEAEGSQEPEEPDAES